MVLLYSPLLAQQWGTSIETASNTLTSTTTCAVRFYPADEFSRRFCTRQGQHHFPHLRTRWYSDTLVSTTVLKCGYQCRQLFCNDEDWAVVVPMWKKADAGDALNQTVQEYGIMEFGLRTDNAGEESGDHTKWEQVQKHFLIPRTLTEPYSPWMNWAEGEIGCTKMHYRRIMNHHQCPKTLWCFGMEYTSALRERITCPGWFGESVTIGTVDWRDPGYFRVHRL